MQAKVSVVLIILIFASSVLAVNATTQVKTIQIAPSSTETMMINLKAGDKFTGIISISGDLDNDIDFSLTNPYGIMLTIHRISQERQIEFTAQSSGIYIFHLGNLFSQSSKTVTINYDVIKSTIDNDIENKNLFASILPTLILIIVTIGIIAGIFRYKIKKINKHKKPILVTNQLVTKLF